jgi:hypothetical protein
MGQLYASLTDFGNFGVVSTAFGQLTQPQIQAQLQSASDYASSKMGARYVLPLTAWDTSITQAVVQIAAYQCMCLRGFDPQNPGDTAARDLWMAAREFFDAVERQHAHPQITESPLPTQQAQPSVAAPMVIGQPLQGWMPGQGCQPQTQSALGTAPPPGSGWPAGSQWPYPGYPNNGGWPPPGVF